MTHNTKNVSPRTQKGFTLIELIVTIAILAIILTIVVVAINPAEQLSRSRDAKRVADLDSVKTAITLYLAQATTTVVMGSDSGGTGCTDHATKRYYMGRSTTTSTPAGFTTSTPTSTQTVGASGWMPARMDQTPGGAAIPVLPVDPAGVGTTNDFWYAYACDHANKAFEVTARLESNYFKTDIDVDGSDGGNSAGSYETGNDPGLDLIPTGY
jgi:prepilin-type N-terminal cleavage/methylation domain-containing protein